jgi:hypothetical protein
MSKIDFGTGVMIHTFSPFNPSDQIIFLGFECFLLKLMSLERNYEETEKCLSRNIHAETIKLINVLPGDEGK